MDCSNSTLVDQLYKRIKEDIVGCDLAARQKLIFRELAARYAASETPLKQALNRLVAEGLVESIPRKGMWVRKITDSEILEILDIRLMIELYDIENVIIALNSNLKLRHMFEENLRAHYDYGKKYSNISEYLKLYNVDQAFHELLVYCTGNKKLQSIYANLNSHAYASYIYGRQPREKVITGIDEHQAIYDALIAGDRDSAEAAIRLHNRNAREIITLMLKLDRF